MNRDTDPRGLDRIVRMRREGREQARQSYRDASRQRLLRNTTTKIRTTMIGSISRVEEMLGSLWGQGKSRKDLTERERHWDAVREELRTAILNLGNAQIRAATQEIEQYEVSWNRYQYEAGPDGLLTETNRGI